MYRVGLDCGSSYTKGVLVDDERRIVDRLAVRTGYDYRAASGTVLRHFAERYDVARPVYTCGYGREQVEAPHAAASEIIALAAAVHAVFPMPADVIDIGGQDTKHIRISSSGRIESFKMNRKCAAGTGAFLEEIAFRLGMDPLLFDAMGRSAADEIRLSSYCTVFATSEIIGLITNGVPMPAIVRGVYHSIVKRCEELAPPRQTLFVTGGVPSRHPMIVEMLRKRWPEVRTTEHAEFLAAFGCVLLSEKREAIPCVRS